MEKIMKFQTRLEAAKPEAVAELAQQMQSEYDLLEIQEIAALQRRRLRIKTRRVADNNMEDMQ